MGVIINTMKSSSISLVNNGQILVDWGNDCVTLGANKLLITTLKYGTNCLKNTKNGLKECPIINQSISMIQGIG